jgi:Holliday junction resolvase RusA-like endonuclease
MTLYTPQTTKVYEDCVALVARASRARYTREVGLVVEIMIYTNKKSPADCDNIAKSVLDGMQKGGMIEDDSQVWNLYVSRIRSPNPRVCVSVTPTQEQEEI